MTDERIALVTGATGMIGEAIARGLAERGLAVVMAARDLERARKVRRRIERAVVGAKVSIEPVELSSAASIEELAGRWRGPLHVLVDDAAQTPRQRLENDRGVELQWATNVLGYHRMMRAFEDVLAASAPARIVNVASYWAGDLDLDDPEFRRRPYDNDTAYRQSKQADRMLSAWFAERLADRGVTVNACHPGDVPSKLAKNLGFGGSDTPAQAADTPVWLASDPALDDVTGRYFEHRRARDDRFVGDRDAVEALAALCRSYG